jgi:UDP-2,3-diacylglucosamine hydrolase
MGKHFRLNWVNSLEIKIPVLKERKNIYFASDFHLGLPAGSDPLEREKRIVKWLNAITPEAAEIYLLGDIFDFWWEYKLVVPKGFTRFLGTISKITDSGIPVHFFTGNHDMWIGNYLVEECGVIIHKSPHFVTFNDKIFYLAHGEGLGTKDVLYKILLSIFRNRPLQVLYSAIHPTIGVGIGHKWSLNSRLGKGISLEFMGEEKEDLIRHSKNILESNRVDYFLYGHRHLAMTFKLEQGAEIFFLGDWFKKGFYAEWDGVELRLKTPANQSALQL